MSKTLTRDEAIKLMRDEGRECYEADGDVWRYRDMRLECRDKSNGEWFQIEAAYLLLPELDTGWTVVPRKKKVTQTAWLVRDSDGNGGRWVTLQEPTRARSVVVTEATLTYEVDE